MKFVDEKSVKKKLLARNKLKKSIEKLSEVDFLWVIPLAEKLEIRAPLLGRFVSEVFLKISENPLSSNKNIYSFWESVTKFWHFLSPETVKNSKGIEKAIVEIEDLFNTLNSKWVKDPKHTQQKLSESIVFIARLLKAKPQIVVLLGQPDLLEEALGKWGTEISEFLKMIPTISLHAAENFPELRELLFRSLFDLSLEDRQEMYLFSEECMRECYLRLVFPKLKKTLESDIRSVILLPIIEGAIATIPGESCLNTVLTIISTPFTELTIYRIISIAIQELGGLYVKISQVISEICPPGLARELRRSQDDAGGLFPSLEASWEYFCAALDSDEFHEIREYLTVPKKPVRQFASASVGALYEIPFNETGKLKFGIDQALIKLKRPGISALIDSQFKHLISLCESTFVLISENQKLSKQQKSELIGISQALKRAITNYYTHSATELDFTYEETNANRVRKELGADASIHIPKYFISTKNAVVMERMPGLKVTKIVQTKYLERRDIADKIVVAYLRLMLEKGVVWADPHPGNILYDDVSNKISMIDLNPCYLWDTKTIENFKNLLYRLMLRDTRGVYAALFELVLNGVQLQKNELFPSLQKFLELSDQSASLARFVGDFLKLLGENEIDLKVEVQAALRGITQLALTCSSISVRNTFAKRLGAYFDWRYILQTTLDVGLFRVIRTVTSILFDLSRKAPEIDVGPVLDERDLKIILLRMQELRKAGVCNIRLVRTSPDENLSLKMSSDESSLIITSELKLVVIEAQRPATVAYLIQVPPKTWLKERQEFVKLASIARNLCAIECLEQLRRNSLDDYWQIIEAWNKDLNFLDLEQLKLVGEVKVAAKKLFALRFRNIFDNPMTGIEPSAKRMWKLLVKIDFWREEAQHSFFAQTSKKLGNIPFTKLAFSTFYRTKMLLIESILFLLKHKIKNLKFALHLLPLTTKELEDTILFGLSRQHRDSRIKNDYL